jgi:hypothetical protein
MPQRICLISEKFFFVERQKFALSAKICINQRHLRQKIQVKNTNFFILSVSSIFAPLCLCAFAINYRLHPKNY